MSKPGWSGPLLPLHVKPQSDELLCSWVARLSLAHGLEPRELCRYLWPARYGWVGDMDRGMNAEVLGVLAKRTATPPKRIFTCTLKAYEDKLFEHLTPYGNKGWLLGNAMHNQPPQRATLQYCPQCLQADRHPYFRRHWRLGFVTVCPTHERCLLDRCPACHVPIYLYRLRHDSDALTRCYQCQFDIRSVDTAPLERSPAYQRLITLQTLLLEGLVTGWCPLGAQGRVRLRHYLRVLYQLVRLLVTPERAARQRDSLCRRLGQPDFEPRFASPTWRALPGLWVADRFQLLLLVAWWVEDWPGQFIRVCAAHQFWPEDLLRQMPSPPSWYEQVVQQMS